jgi:phosphohistidine phosphatase SixA
VSEPDWLIPSADVDGYTHVLLVRHGRTDARAGVRESRRRLSDMGARDVAAVSRRLAEWLSLGQDRFDVGSVRHGHYWQVVLTMAILRRAVRAESAGWPEGDVHAMDALDPCVFWADQKAPENAARWCSPSESKDAGNGGQQSRTRALMIIGHEPQLSLISRELLRAPFLPRRFAWRAHVTPSAGVSCIRLRGSRWQRGRVLWVIEPESKETAQALRDKIKSKMDVAKVFGAVITFALGILLSQLVDATKRKALENETVVLVALAALGLALVLYVSVLYAYDSLLMPTRFWNASAAQRERSRVVRRPPSSAGLVLQQNMVRIWTWPFTFANILVLVSFGLLAYGAIGVAVTWVVAATSFAGFLAWWTRRVDFGAQD